MDKGDRDLERLSLIVESAFGLEAFALTTRMADFTRYYFSRFLINIKDSFKDFSRTELETYLHRYARQIDLTLHDPLLNLDTMVVPIPKDMIHSYQETLDQFLQCLDHIDAVDLVTQLEDIVQRFKVSEFTTLPKPSYQKTAFDKDKSVISKLYRQQGLSVTPAKMAFTSLDNVNEVKVKLDALTRFYYPMILSLRKAIDALEHTHAEITIPSDQAKIVQTQLMSLAYRVSIFAVIMDHLQKMEHAFVKVLEQLRQTSART